MIVALTSSSFALASDGCEADSRNVTWCTVDRIGTEDQANNHSMFGQYTPVTAVLSNGNYVVVWASEYQDGSFEGIFARIFMGATGVPVTDDIPVNAFTNHSQQRPSVAGLTAGGFVVAWQSDQQDGSREGVFVRVFTSAGVAQRSAETRANEVTAGGQFDPVVVALPNTASGFVVAWQSEAQDGSLEGIYARVFYSANAASGISAGSEFRVNTFTAGAQLHPAISVIGSDGDFVIVWESSSGVTSGDGTAGRGIFGQVFNATGGPSGREFRVNSFTSGEQRHPAVVQVGSAGAFAVAWGSSESLSGASTDTILVRHFRASDYAATGAEQQVNTWARNGQRFPAMATLPEGGFAVLWQSEARDGNAEAIVGQVYNSTAQPVLSEFVINSYSAGAQLHPHAGWLARQGDGRSFVVAWSSNGQDGSLRGVFTRRIRYGRRPSFSCSAEGETGISYYGETPRTSSECVPLLRCRASLCRCFLGPSFGGFNSSVSSSSSSSVNGSSVNGTNSSSNLELLAAQTCFNGVTDETLKAVSCDQQATCITTFRNCVEDATLAVVPLSSTTGASTSCRTWARVFRDATLSTSSTTYDGSPLQQSCSATVCGIYSAIGTRCAYLGDQTDEQYCRLRPLVYVATAATSGNGSGSGSSGSGDSGGSGGGSSSTGPAGLVSLFGATVLCITLLLGHSLA